MEILSKILVILHVIAGFTAFFIGPIAIFTDKFGKPHKVVGKVFSIAMAIVFVTAVVVSIYKGYVFLFMVAVFSFYSVYSGVRILKLKRLKRGQKEKWFDWAVHAIFLITCLSFLTYAATLFYERGVDTLAILCVLFGVGGIFSVRTNTLPFWSKEVVQSFWLDYHRSNMIGAYVATVTAFSAQQMHFMPGLLQWTWPSLVILPLSSYFNKKYKSLPKGVASTK